MQDLSDSENLWLIISDFDEIHSLCKILLNP